MSFLTIPEFCEQRGLQASTLRRRMNALDGVIVPAKIECGKRFYLEEDLESLEEAVNRSSRQFNPKEFLRQYSLDGVAYAAARECGVTAQSVRKYAATHPEFKAEMERLKEQVEKRNREKSATAKGGHTKPDGAQFLTDGTLYKFGVHGKAFYWSGFEWVLATRMRHEIMSGRRLKA